jgi:hypothetical protein
MPIAANEDIAGRLDEVAHILAEQGANRFRVQAYHQTEPLYPGSLAVIERAILCKKRSLFDKICFRTSPERYHA